MNIQSYYCVRHFVHFKAEESPSCLISCHVARVNEVFDLVYEYSLLFFLVFDLGSVVSLVNVFEEVFYCRERSTDLYIDNKFRIICDSLSFLYRPNMSIWDPFQVIHSWRRLSSQYFIDLPLELRCQLIQNLKSLQIVF